MKIQTKLLILVTSLIVTPLVVLGLIAFNQLSRDLSEHLFLEMNNSSALLGQSLSSELELMSVNTQLLANSASIQSYISTTDDEVRYGLHLTSVMQEMAAYQKVFPQYQDIRIILSNGEGDVTSSLRDGKNNESEIGTIHRIIQASAEPSFTSSFVHKETGRAAWLIVTPLDYRDLSDDPINSIPKRYGYLTFGLSLSFAQSLAQEIRFGQSGFHVITDKEGNIIATGNKSFEGLSAKKLNKFISQAEGGGTSIIVSGGADGYYAQTTKLLDDFYLVSVLPKPDFSEALYELSLATFGILLVALIVTFMLMYVLLNRFIVRPIIKLQKAAEQFGSGDLLAPIKIRSSDEFGKLAGSLRDMGRKLHEAHDDLEKKTIELGYARDKAQEANAAKSRFLANMSHELRTPLNGLLGMAELLTSTRLTAAQSRYIDLIQASGRGLLNIITEILDMSRIEAGKLTLDVKAFDLHDLVKNALYLHWTTASGKGVELRLYMDEEVPRCVIGDAQRIGQILLNLLGNAVKFTEEGSIVLSVEQQEDSEKECKLHFEVKDTGIGFEGRDGTRLFKAFEQADDSFNRRFGGAGLGLSICKQLIGLMKGDIGAESVLGEGSTFWFTVTLPKAEKDEIEALVGEVPISEDMAGASVLIVDDNEANRESLKGYCERWGMVTYIAENASVALEILEERAASDASLDVILSDMKMPGMSGLDFIREFRQRQPDAAVPVILLNSMVIGSTNRELKDLGVVQSLMKPIFPDQLCKAMISALRSGVRSTGDGCDASFEAYDEQESLNLKVLVAEDNPVNREVMIEHLGALGCSHKIAENGIEALDLFRAEAFDLVLMDCQMPECDGLMATRRIRAFEALSGRAQTPVIAVTAHALSEEKDACREAGMDNYLTKPFQRADLVSVIQEVLREQGTLGTHKQTGQETEAAPLIAASEANTSIDHDILDRDVFDGLHKMQLANKSDLLQRICGAYKDSAPKLVEEFKEAAHVNDIGVMRRVAHTLKSSSATLGANAFSQDMAALEQSLIAGDFDVTRFDLKAFEASLEQVLEALEEALGDVVLDKTASA